MADILDIYKPEWWAQESLLQIWPRLTMARLVHRDFQDIVSEAGDTVNSRIPDKFTAVDVDSTNTGANFAAATPTAKNVQVKMNQHKQVVFGWSDKEEALAFKRINEEFMPNAAAAMAEALESALMAEYKAFYYRLGAPGAAPNDVAKIGTNVKQRFDDLWIPRDSRNVVLGPEHENYFNQVFWKANESGSATQQIVGELTRKFGLDYFGADMLPTHTAGTAVGDVNMTCSCDISVAGDTDTGIATLTVAAGTEAQRFEVGDLLEIGASKAEYVVVAAAAVAADGSASPKISPVPPADIAGGTAVKVVATHKNSMCFNRGAISLVSRPLMVPSAPGANVDVKSFEDIALRSSVWYEPKDMKTYVRLDLLFGTKVIDARKGFRFIS